MVSATSSQVSTGSTAEHATVLFTEEDLVLFSSASGDRNPLHLSHFYARSTAYGQPVVFGCLGAIACLGKILLPDGWSARSIEAEFARPMFSNIEYRFETSQKDNKWRVRLFDGSAAVVSITLTAELHRENPVPQQIAVASSFERSEAVTRLEADIVPGLEVSGFYACNSRALASLASRWGIADRFLLQLLCWSSYLVGMELPGESALFSRLVLNVDGRESPAAVMAYRAAVASVDSRFGQVTIDVSLFNDGWRVASGRLSSFMRSPVPRLDEIDSTQITPGRLAGRVAILLGSSRGLGASMQQALELRGATVYGMARSENTARRPQTEMGDAKDPGALRRLRDRVLEEHGRLDFLICNACPPVLPLRLEENAVERISDYIHEAVALALAPLAAFLELLNSSGGCVVMISSVYVDHPVKEFPHYVAAKQAVEMLGRVATLQYRRVRTLIVRPPKLLTAMTNTPLGRVDAASPALIANRVAARLESPPEPGSTEILG